MFGTRVRMEEAMEQIDTATVRMSGDTELLDTTEAIRYLRSNRNAVFGWIRSGELPHIRLGTRRVLFRRCDLDEFLAARVQRGR